MLNFCSRPRQTIRHGALWRNSPESKPCSLWQWPREMHELEICGSAALNRRLQAVGVCVPLASAVELELELASPTGDSGSQGTADAIVPTLKVSMLLALLFLFPALARSAVLSNMILPQLQ